MEHFKVSYNKSVSIQRIDVLFDIHENTASFNPFFRQLYSLMTESGFYATKTVKTWLVWSPMTPCNGPEWAGLTWHSFSAFSRILLMFFSMSLMKRANRWNLMFIGAIWLKLLINTVPTATRQWKAADIYSWTTTSQHTLPIKRKTAFLFRILTFSATHRITPPWL